MITVPAFVGAIDIRQLLRVVEEVGLAEPGDGIIRCDASSIKFVDPLGLCMLAYLDKEACSFGQRLVLQGLPERIEGYMRRMDVFGGIGAEAAPPGHEGHKRHNRSDALVEVQEVVEPNRAEPVAADIARAITGQQPRPEHFSSDGPRGSPADRIQSALRHIFSETLDNALSHGRKHGRANASAYLACQYYPGKDKVRVAVVDTGCGFLRSLRDHPRLPDRSHQAAVHLALQPRVSCNPDVGVLVGTHNQGVGLTICKGIVGLCGGTMLVGSGDGAVKVSGDREQLMVFGHGWNGSFLYCELTREKIARVHIDQVVATLPQEQDAEPVNIRFLD